MLLADIDWNTVAANAGWTFLWVVLGLIYLLLTPLGWVFIGGWLTRFLGKKGPWLFWIVLLIIVGSEFTQYTSGETFWDFAFTHVLTCPIPIDQVQQLAPLQVLRHLFDIWGGSLTIPGSPNSPTPTPTPNGGIPTN